MRKGIWFDLVKLLGVFAIMWAAFAYLPAYTPDSWKPDFAIGDHSFEISIEQEEKLGDFIMDNFMDEVDEMHEPIVDSAMTLIQMRLLENIGPTDYEHRIKLVDDPLVNAITLPGGNIIVFKGLLKFAETPEEVAAVLAHELGHVQKRHVVQKLVTELGLTFVISVVTGGDATLIHELTRTLVSGVFSRSQEAEADDFGMQLLLKSEIDPRALADFFRKMNRENMGYSEYLEWLMSHPHNNSRIKSSLEFDVPDTFVAKPFPVNWDRVQQALN